VSQIANKRPAEEGVEEETPEARIYAKIHQAIAERRLAPGARLVEDQLAEVFGVSRARIRSVLQALARDKVVTLNRNRGASIAMPSVQEAREVFAARRLVEVALAREIVQAVDDKALKKLRAHIKKEHAAEKSRDRAMELRTSHDFHLLLAEIVGNSVIADFVRELLARSALITAIFERPNANVCSHISHAQLIELIEKRDADGLAVAMLGHLDEIESLLVLQEKEEGAPDLKEIFAGL
jgi:DNA-binding GntR family transcriptional regulator